MIKYIKSIPILKIKLPNEEDHIIHISGSVDYYNKTNINNKANLYFVTYEIITKHHFEIIVNSIFNNKNFDQLTNTIKSILDKEYNVYLNIIEFNGPSGNKCRKEYYTRNENATREF